MDALLLKVPEAAAQLGVSRAKLYELISSGALPSVRVDGCRRIRRDDLLEFVANLHSVAGSVAMARVAVDCPQVGVGGAYVFPGRNGGTDETICDSPDVSRGLVGGRP